MLASAHAGRSAADVENAVRRMRRSFVLGLGTAAELAGEALRAVVSDLDHSARRGLAHELASISDLSQRAVSKITGISRDTLRKDDGTAPARPRPQVTRGRRGRNTPMAAE